MGLACGHPVCRVQGGVNAAAQNPSWGRGDLGSAAMGNVAQFESDLFSKCATNWQWAVLPNMRFCFRFTTRSTPLKWRHEPPFFLQRRNPIRQQLGWPAGTQPPTVSLSHGRFFGRARAPLTWISHHCHSPGRPFFTMLKNPILVQSHIVVPFPKCCLALFHLRNPARPIPKRNLPGGRSLLIVTPPTS